MTTYCYTNQLSYQAGDEIFFHLSTSAASCTLEISRWGAERVQVYQQHGLKAKNHPTPDNASTHGCGWPVAFSLKVPQEWPSGYYRVIVKGDPNETWEHFFVVRSARPGKENRILLQLATNTYQAYNAWGGSCLYGGSKGLVHQVSFQRPFQLGLLSKLPDSPRMALGERAPLGFAGAVRYPARDWAEATDMERRWVPSAGYGGWEQRFVAWAEQNGFGLDFAINSDLERHPQILEDYSLILSVGHDEYWSWGMRDAIEEYIAGGGNVAFFSGNTCFWQVRWEDAGDTMVCYKYDCKADPILGTADERFLSSIWSDHLVKRPENSLTGVSFTRGGYARFGAAVPRGSGGYTVWRPAHWVFDDTGLEYGDQFGDAEAIVGYECDGCEIQLVNGLPVPTYNDGTPAGFTILATSPATLAERVEQYGEEIYLRHEDLDFCAERVFGVLTEENKAKIVHGNAVMGIYEAGGTVFTTGCTEWAYGLAAQNPFVEQITRNLLKRLSSK